MTVIEELQARITALESAMAEAERDVKRMDQLELTQRADVCYSYYGEQELIGYEWGCGGPYSTARDALDAAIDAAIARSMKNDDAS